MLDILKGQTHMLNREFSCFDSCSRSIQTRDFGYLIERATTRSLQEILFTRVWDSE